MRPALYSQHEHLVPAGRATRLPPEDAVRAESHARQRQQKLISEHAVSSAVLRHGPLELDTTAKDLRVGGTRVTLTAYEYNLLEYMMLHPSKVISKTELTEHLYAQDFERDSNVIEVFVGRLRRKLDPLAGTSTITTVRGQGYRLLAAEG